MKNETSRLYTTEELAERRNTRRSAEDKITTRVGLGALAVMAATGLTIGLAGGPRPFTHDVERFASDQSARVSRGLNYEPKPGRLQRDVVAQTAQNEVDRQIATASAESGGASVTEIPQGK